MPPSFHFRSGAGNGIAVDVPSIELEGRIAEIHERVLIPLAGRLAFDLGRASGVGTGTPMVLFLGNHSSGKSSFINFLLGEPVQTTGLAPTDDGFTVLTAGPQNATSDGPTVASHPQLNLVDLGRLGPAFASKLRLKTVVHDLLRTVTLVDSPGMIDAVGAANTRGYDFPAAVRAFAERADLILFFFDPDKPGTTAESIFVLTRTLAGLGYKLMLVLNKVDQFGSFRDFARTYGALCWNLAKAIPTKDIPHIATCYLPSTDPAAPRRSGGLPLADFDASRAEILSEIRRTPGRRRDHLVTDLLQRGRELRVHARVCRQVALESRRQRVQAWGALVLTVVLAGLAIWLAWLTPDWPIRLWVAVIAVAVVAVVGGLGRWQIRSQARRSADPSSLESAFASAFERELALADRADLRADWEAVKERTLRTVQTLGPAQAGGGWGSGRLVGRLERSLETEIPALRRDLGQPQPELPLPG
jgi:hypothetical protein